MTTATPADMPSRKPHEQLAEEVVNELADVDEAPLTEALERLTNASEALSGILESSAGSVQSAIPGINQKG